MRRHRPTHQEPGVIGRDLDPNGPMPSEPRRVPGWEQRTRARNEQTAELMGLFGQMTAHLGGLLTLAQAPPLNDVLGQMSAFIPAAGALQKGWKQNFQSVTVTNFGASQVTVTAQGIQEQAPTVGSGVAVVPPGVERTMQLRGSSVTIYGAAGSLVELVAYARPRAPQSSPCLLEGSSELVAVAQPAAGAEFSVSPSPDAPFDIVAAQYLLTTGVNAGVRTPALGIGPFVAFTGETQAASTFDTYSFWPAADGSDAASIPAGPFPAGTVVASSVGGLLPVDQISAISLVIATT